VGYGLGRTLSADLAMAALLDAISKRNTDDLIHHSDQGIQYCSLDYVEVLKEHGITIFLVRLAALFFAGLKNGVRTYLAVFQLSNWTSF